MIGIEEIFARIVKLEELDTAATRLTWRSIHTWPLIRQCIWVMLTSDKAIPSPILSPPEAFPAKIRKYFKERFRYPIKSLGRQLKESLRPLPLNDSDSMFISRPIQLQPLPSGLLFDKIVDPLITNLNKERRFSKFYLSPLPPGRRLEFPAKHLLAPKIYTPRLPEEHKKALEEVAAIAKLDAAALQSFYAGSFQDFVNWFAHGKRVFACFPSLKKIYVVAWYFADVMGLAAAAHQYGIQIIDIQHGKQGRYQAMYSGWTRIPERGYQMLPNQFWCWGKPSCRHILATSPTRTTHQPFVGGLPWLEYYMRHIAPPNAGQKKCASKDRMRQVLLTTQHRVPINPEPIPDFIVDFLRNPPPDMHFVIRCHPNDPLGTNYIERRLAEISPTSYSIDSNTNLYDSFLEATHHITAFSSCCYEATALGLPTLLFGHTARELYVDEINSGEFSWTDGNIIKLKDWLDENVCTTKNGGGEDNYIRTSLDLANKIINRDIISPSTI